MKNNSSYKGYKIDADMTDSVRYISNKGTNYELRDEKIYRKGKHIPNAFLFSTESWKMQQDMIRAQQELEASIFYGSAGGKIVQVEFTGNRKMKNIVIDKEAIESSEDLEILQDTIIAAVNDCINKIDDETESVMSEFTGGGMPGLF